MFCQPMAMTYLLIEVAQVTIVSMPRAAYILIRAAGVRWPFQLGHLQPVGEVDHTATFELKTDTMCLSVKL